MNINELLQDLSGSFPISVYLSKYLKSTNAAIFYGYIQSLDKDDQGWVCKTQDEIYQGAGLTADQQVTARRKLREANLLEEKEERLLHKKYYRCFAFSMEA
jgi:hypothetical protein